MRAGALDREEDGQVGLISSLLSFNVNFAKVGVAVFLPLYPRVVSWLQEKLGSYQNVVLAKASR